MEKDKDKPFLHHHGHGGGLPLPSSTRYSSSSSSLNNNFNAKAESSISPSLQQESGQFNHSMSSDTNRFSHDISRMSDLPPKKNLGHRRAHSEILSLPDDISFDSNLGVVGSGDGPSFSDETEDDLFSMYIDLENFTATSGDLSAQGISGTGVQLENQVMDFNDRPRIRHHHSQSMDGSTSIQPELLISGSEGPSFNDSKKSISASKLADLALVDPKRAKRIWANRQSAARSKERKMRYISELERKVQTLQTEATTLSAQLTLLQRDTSGLTAENSELKLRLHTMEQQVHLQDALNDALRDEVQRLKLVTGQNIGGGGSMNFGSSHGPSQQFYPNNHAMHTLLAAHHFQQLQIHSQQQSHQLQQQQQFEQDMKLKGSLPSPSQRETASDTNSSAKD